MAEGGSERNATETDAEKDKDSLEYQDHKMWVRIEGKRGNVAIGDNNSITTYHEYKSKQKKKLKKPKKPITESKEKLTTAQRQNISENLGKDWKKVGRRLGFENGKLEQIQMDNPNQSSETNYEMLLKWEQDKDDDATRSALAQVFGKIGRGDLQDLLADDV